VTKLASTDREATLVETAIVLPLVLLLVFGILDGARYVAAKNAVQTASHEAARYGSSVGDNDDGDKRYADCDGMRAEGIALSGGPKLDASHFSIIYDSGPGSSALTGDCSGSDSTASVSEGDRVVVTVSQSRAASTPLVNSVFGPFTVPSTAKRTILSP
jgi:hypothetical protein